MGSAADEIDRKIRRTRDHMDENLGVLEDRTTSNAMRYGRMVAIAVGVAAAAGAGFLVYRRLRRRSRREQLQRTLVDLLKNLPDSLRDAPHEVASRFKPHELASRLKNSMPSVRVVVNGTDEGREPGTLESIVRRVAPAVVGTASTAVLERLTRTPEDRSARSTHTEYS